MSIRFTKFKGDHIITVQRDNEDIIKSCFVFCRILVRKNVERFVNEKRRCVTLHFKDYSVRLER